jgi:MoaA/NifB/PqqE/SkfB family radical SAM enzyme
MTAHFRLEARNKKEQMTNISRIKLLSVHTDTSLEDDLTKSNLVSLWIEQPANCNLFCPMCFAKTVPRHKKAPQYIPDHVYEAVIRDFASMPGGIKKLAIPGAGEPFHDYNRELTWKMIRLTAELDMALTIFTTAHLMTDEDIETLRAYEHVLLLVKYNSRNRKIQEELVFENPANPTDPTYFDRRETVFAKMIKAGFNTPQSKENQEKYGNHTRLGIVTSIMEQNIDEIVPLLEMARDNNLVFDCDTILPRGRGQGFTEKHRRFCSGQELDMAIRRKIEELQDVDRIKYNNEWQIGGTYVGATCTRFCNHLYIDFKGDVHPCIGSTKVTLGNIVHYKEGDLSRCWNNPEMRVIRDRKYSGVCPTCIHFGVDCHSCLGRSTYKTEDNKEKALNSENLAKYGVVCTHGCLNHLPKVNVLISKKSEQLRNILLAGKVSDTEVFTDKADLAKPAAAISTGRLENLWRPEQATVGNPGEGILFFKDHILPNLEGAPWRWEVNKKDNFDQLLPFIFLPVIARLFANDLDPEQILLWCNLLLYDEIKEGYFYRIVMREDNDAARANILLSRWAEAEQLLKAEQIGSACYSEKILDLSDILRDKQGHRFNYRIVLQGDHIETTGAVGVQKTFDLRAFFVSSKVKNKIGKIRKFLLEAGRENSLVSLVTTKIFSSTVSSSLTNQEKATIRDFYQKLAGCFTSGTTAEISALGKYIPQDLLDSCLSVQADNLANYVKQQLINYLIFLGAMHEDLAGYEVRHSKIHGQPGSDSSGIVLATKCSANKIRSSLGPQQLPDETLATVDIALNTILLPVISVYEKDVTVKRAIKQTSSFMDAVLHHDMKTAYNKLTTSIDKLLNDVAEKSLSDEDRRKKLKHIQSLFNLAFTTIKFNHLWAGDGEKSFLREKESLADLKKHFLSTLEFERFSLVCEGEWPTTTRVPTALRMVFANLIQNARKFNSEVYIQVSSDQYRIQFLVKNKEGMAKDWREKAFTGEYSPEIPQKHRGLWICRTILRNLGGTWYIEPESNSYKTAISFSVAYEQGGQ